MGHGVVHCEATIEEPKNVASHEIVVHYRHQEVPEDRERGTEAEIETEGRRGGTEDRGRGGGGDRGQRGEEGGGTEDRGRGGGG
jgi:hypothetical protein